MRHRGSLSLRETVCVRAFPVTLLAVWILLGLTACGSPALENPAELLLEPADFPGIAVSVVSTSEEQSLDGPTALVELQGPGFRVLQTLILFETREQALSALDGIRADLVSRGETGPGEREASGIFRHPLGDSEAASLFFIESNGLVRLTVTGPDRENRLRELAAISRERLKGN